MAHDCFRWTPVRPCHREEIDSRHIGNFTQDDPDAGEGSADNRFFAHSSHCCVCGPGKQIELKPWSMLCIFQT